MKKSAIIILLLINCVMAQSQIVQDTITAELSYKKVFETKLSKDEIKVNANTWLVEAYESANKKIKLNNDEKIITKGSYEGTLLNELGHENKCTIHYTLDIAFKEGKYRVYMHSFNIKSEDYPLFAEFFLKHPTNNIEVYKKSLLRNIKPGSTKEKKMLLLFKNTKKLERRYEYQKRRDEHIMNQILEQYAIIAEGLSKYMKKQEPDKW